MSIRFATATAIAVLVAAPAFADCEAEIASLDEAVVAAQTGAGVGDTGLPATQHQAEVLEIEPAAGADAGTDVGGAAAPITEHQQEVLADAPDEGGVDPGALLGEARELAAAGDEAGCMQKLEEARMLLDVDG